MTKMISSAFKEFSWSDRLSLVLQSTILFLFIIVTCVFCFVFFFFF